LAPSWLPRQQLDSIEQRGGGDKRAIDRYRGLCACGDHAWSVLTKGFITLVSPEDAHLLQQRRWCAQRNSRRRNLVYAVAKKHKQRRNIFLHRQILGDAADVETDHKNHNGLDNRRSNLRPCPRNRNQANSQRKNKSGFRGVYLYRKRWQAQITYKGKK